MICFAWTGFPQYAARCIGALVRSTNEHVVVVADKPSVPVVGMEAVCNCEIVWIPETDNRTLKELCGEIPRHLFVSGWGLPRYDLYCDEVHAVGGHVTAMCDNNFLLSFKEVLRSIRFRFLLSRKYESYLVPGRSGRRLMRFYGVPDYKVFTGLYAADANVFKVSVPINQRAPAMICVGRLNERKNVLAVCRSFLAANKERVQKWKLILCGCGPLADQIPQDSSIEVRAFVQPELLAAMYNEAKVFVLASKEEHWGLVVHEAALSGCFMLLSDRVGAVDDFAGSLNARMFDPFKEEEILAAMQDAMSLDASQFAAAERESVSKAQGVSVADFVTSVHRILAMGDEG